MFQSGEYHADEVETDSHQDDGRCLHDNTEGIFNKAKMHKESSDYFEGYEQSHAVEDKRHVEVESRAGRRYKQNREQDRRGWRRMQSVIYSVIAMTDLVAQSKMNIWIVERVSECTVV
jgi:hypothetical protein